MRIGCDFFCVPLKAYRQITIKDNASIFITICKSDKSIFWNNIAVACFNVLIGINTESYRSDFTVIADTECLIICHNLFKWNRNLLSIVIHRNVGWGNGNILSCIGEFSIILGGIMNIAVRCSLFNHSIFTEIKFFWFSHTVIIGCDCINQSTLFISYRTVKCCNILGSIDFKHCTFKITDAVFWSVYTVIFFNGWEHLSCFCNIDYAFLSHILCFNLDYGYSCVRGRIFLCNRERYRCVVKHISVRCLYFFESIITIRQLFRCD